MTSVRLEYKLREAELAIVLLDLIGSTAFVQKAGPIKAARWLQYHDRLTRSLCYKFNGREIDRSDGFLMSFDNVIDAVNFSLYYQATIPQKIKLGCRIGIHYGRIVEVHQHELLVGAGAKQVELEGVAKNIAARTMSLCGRGQVLLTEDAMKAVKGRTNKLTPKSTRYACVGLYKFKGVRESQTIYAVGTTLESLQPPKGGDKVKRLGGPKRVRLKIRQMKLEEIINTYVWKATALFLLFVLLVLAHLSSNSFTRDLLNLHTLKPLGDIYLISIESIKEVLKWINHLLQK